MLREFRKKAGLSQVELADLVGWGGPAGQRRISYIETSKAQVRLEDCRQLVSALNTAGIDCTIDEVFPPADSASDASSEVA